MSLALHVLLLMRHFRSVVYRVKKSVLHPSWTSYGFICGPAYTGPPPGKQWTRAYDGESRSVRTGRLERELQIVQLSATIATL